MKKQFVVMGRVAMYILFVFVPTFAQATSAEVVDCKFSWACFKKAAQTCSPAKVKKTPPSIEILGVKNRVSVVIEITGEDANGMCRFTNTPYRFKYIPTAEYIDLVMKQDGISERKVRSNLRKMEKFVNNAEAYSQGVSICTGTRDDIGTLFKHYMREFKRMEGTFTTEESKATFLEQKIECTYPNQ